MHTGKTPSRDSNDAPSERVRSAADAMTTLLRVAEALAESGRAVDLDGLTAHIGRLCAAALDLPPDRGREAAPHLSMLLAALDALASRLNSNAPVGTGGIGHDA